MGAEPSLASEASDARHGSVQSNTKYGEWEDGIDCQCSTSRCQVLAMRIVRTPLLSAASDMSFSAIRVTANVVSIGYVEKWLGTNNIPLEHQAIECDVCCIDCMHSTNYTFEFLGGIGKLDRVGSYTRKYNADYKQRKIKNTILYLSDIYDIFHSIPGRWQARHYDAVQNNCQKFAHLFWSQLFGSEEDDFGEWQSQTQFKCKCKTDIISVKKIKLIRVQKNCDSDETRSSVINNTLNILSLGAVDTKSLKDENNLVLHAIELYCKCNKCQTNIYYTLENSQRGKYFRCGLYGKQLKPFRQIQKRKSLTLKKVHNLYKQFNFRTTDNRQWTLDFWDNLFSDNSDGYDRDYVAQSYQ